VKRLEEEVQWGYQERNVLLRRVLGAVNRNSHKKSKIIYTRNGSRQKRKRQLEGRRKIQVELGERIPGIFLRRGDDKIHGQNSDVKKRGPRPHLHSVKKVGRKTSKRKGDSGKEGRKNNSPSDNSRTRPATGIV